MNIPYDEMPEKIEELMIEVERLESENKHLLDLQKSMDQQYEVLEETSKAYKKLLKTTMQKEHQAIKVLDEIREFTNNHIMLIYTKKEPRELVGMNKLLQILDKVKE